MNSTKAAANRSNREGAKRNLVSISPFFIVKDLQASVGYYTDRLGFQLDFEGPADGPYYARVSRDGIGIMLKAILPDVLPCPNHTRHEWARWDANIYTLDSDALFDEFSQRGVSFVQQLSISLPSFRSATSRVSRNIADQHPNGADARRLVNSRGSFGA